MKITLLIAILLLPCLVYSQVSGTTHSYSDKEWQFVGNQGISMGDVWCPNIAFSPSGELYISFPDGGDSARASVMRFDGSNWVCIDPQGISPIPCVLAKLQFKSTGQPVVIILDNFLCLSAYQYNGATWDTIGNQKFTSQTVSFSFIINPFDTLYIVFQDGVDYKLSAMKFNGNQWVYVGPRYFASYAMYPSMAIDSSGIPYVGYSDGLYHDGLSVMKFNGLEWEYVGPRGFTTSSTLSKHLQFSPSNELYVASNGYWYRLRLQKLTNNQWIDIGYPGISDGHAYYVKLAFSSMGVPYILFEDWATNRKATVKKFENTWNDVGEPGFSPGEMECGDIRLDSFDVPYVTFVNYADSGKASVMMYDYPVAIDVNKEYSVNIYPNPARNWIRLTLESPQDQDNSIIIYNIMGDLMFGKTFSSKDIKINIENLPSGLYLVVVKTKESSYSMKFLKE